MKGEYALFNAFILVSSTLGLMLYPQSRWPQIKPAIQAILSVALPFIIWDYAVSEWWWSFSSLYTLGFNLGKLPLEEILFFFIVPWSCLTLWANLKEKVSGHVTFPIEAGALGLAGVWSLSSWVNQAWYSLSICALLAGVVMLSYTRHHWLQQKRVLLFLTVVTVLTLVFNTYLTARPIVLYNPEVMLPWRVGSVPVEDVFYGLGLMSLVIMLYEHLISHPRVSKKHTNAS